MRATRSSKRRDSQDARDCSPDRPRGQVTRPWPPPFRPFTGSARALKCNKPNRFERNMLRLIARLTTVMILTFVAITAASAQDFQNMSPCEQLALTAMQFTKQISGGKSIKEEKAYVVDQEAKYPPSWPVETIFGLLDYLYKNNNRDLLSVGNQVTKICRSQLPDDHLYSIRGQMKYCGELGIQAYYIVGDRNRGVTRQNALNSIQSRISEKAIDDVTYALNFIYDNKQLSTNQILDKIQRKCLVGPNIVFATEESSSNASGMSITPSSTLKQSADVGGHQGLGPSFNCPTPRDSLGQLICNDADLSKMDLIYVQAYESVRQKVGQEGQKALRAEAVKFNSSTREQCNIPMAGLPASTNLPDSSRACVMEAYRKQRDILMSQLSGPAADEANRPIEFHVALQATLIRNGFLPSSAKADGVYGSGTRQAIVAWQKSAGRDATGFLSNDDASALVENEPKSSRSTTPEGQPQPITGQENSAVRSSAMGKTVAQIQADFPNMECSDDLCTFGQNKTPQQLCPKAGPCDELTLFVANNLVVGYNATFSLQAWDQSLKASTVLNGNPKRKVIGPSENIKMRNEYLSWPMAGGLELTYTATSGTNFYGAPLDSHSIGIFQGAKD